MADTLQTDNYGRIVDISTEDFIKGVTSACKNRTAQAGPDHPATKLEELGGKTEMNRSKFMDDVKPLMPMFSDNMDIDEILQWLENIHTVMEAMAKKREEVLAARKEKSEGGGPVLGGGNNSQNKSEFKNLSSSLEEAFREYAENDGMWNQSRATAMDKFLYEAVHGHSLHVHDFTAVRILTSIARDVKHIGMIISNTVGDAVSDAQRGLVGSFDQPIRDRRRDEPDDLLPGGGRLRRRMARAMMGDGGMDEAIDAAGAGAPPGRGRRRRRRGPGEPIIIDDGDLGSPDAMVIPDAGSGSDGMIIVGDDGRPLPRGRRGGGGGGGGPEMSDPLEMTRERLIELMQTAEQAALALKRNAHHFDALPHQMEGVGIALGSLAGQSRLSEDQLQSIALGVRNLHSLDKSDRLRLENAIKDLHAAVKSGDTDRMEAAGANAAAVAQRGLRQQERDDWRKTFQASFEYYTNKMIKMFDFLRSVLPAFGLGKKFDPIARSQEIVEESNDWVRKVHMELGQSYGMKGTLMGDPGKWGYRQAPGFMGGNRNFMEAGNEMVNRYDLTGTDVKKTQAVMLKNLSRGVTMLSRWRTLSMQGMQLGRMIGVDAESTAEELTDWHQQLHLSVTETGQLMRDIQAVSRVTGVTGEKLMEAVKASKAMAENMRNAGTMTAQANRNLIQLTATAQKRGTDKIIQPLLDAMSSTVALFDSAQPGTFAFLMQSAQYGGGGDLMSALQDGTIMQNREMGQAMTVGMQQLIDRLTGGKKVSELRKDELMRLNLVTKTAYGMQINEMQMAVDTLTESFDTTSTKMARLHSELDRGMHTQAEENDLKQQILALQKQEKGEQMNEGLRNLTEVSRYTRSGYSLNDAVSMASQKTGKQIDLKAQADLVLAGIREAATDLSGAYSDEERGMLQGRVAEFEAKMAGPLNAQQLTELVGSMDEVVRQNQIWERMFQMDQVAFQAENQERAQRREFEARVRDGLQHIQAWSPPKASLANMYTGLVWGFLQLISKIGLAIIGLMAIRMAFGGLARLMGMFSGRAVPGALPAGASTPAAAARGVPPVVGAPGAAPAARAGSASFMGRSRSMGGAAPWLKLGGAVWLGADAYSGYQKDGTSGMFKQALTGSVEATEGGADTAMVVGRGALIGAMVAGPVGAVVGAFVASGAEMIKQLDRLNQAYKQGEAITQNFVAAQKHAATQMMTDAGQARFAHKQMNQSAAATAADADNIRRSIKMLEAANDKEKAKMGFDENDINQAEPPWYWGGERRMARSNIQTRRAQITKMKAELEAANFASGVSVPLTIMAEELPGLLTDERTKPILEKKMREYVEARFRGQSDTYNQIQREVLADFKIDFGKLYDSHKIGLTEHRELAALEEAHKESDFAALFQPGRMDPELYQQMDWYLGEYAKMQKIDKTQLMQNNALLNEAIKFLQGTSGLGGQIDRMDPMRAAAWRSQLQMMELSVQRRAAGSPAGERLTELRMRRAAPADETAIETQARLRYNMSRERLKEWTLSPEEFMRQAGELERLNSQIDVLKDGANKDALKRQRDDLAVHHVLQVEKLYGDYRRGSVESTWGQMPPAVQAAILRTLGANGRPMDMAEFTQLDPNELYRRLMNINPNIFDQANVDGLGITGLKADDFRRNVGDLVTSVQRRMGGDAADPRLNDHLQKLRVMLPQSQLVQKIQKDVEEINKRAAAQSLKSELKINVKDFVPLMERYGVSMNDAEAPNRLMRYMEQRNRIEESERQTSYVMSTLSELGSYSLRDLLVPAGDNRSIDQYMTDMMRTNPDQFMAQLKPILDDIPAMLKQMEDPNSYEKLRDKYMWGANKIEQGNDPVEKRNLKMFRMAEAFHRNPEMYKNFRPVYDQWAGNYKDVSPLVAEAKKDPMVQAWRFHQMRLEYEGRRVGSSYGTLDGGIRDKLKAEMKKRNPSSDDAKIEEMLRDMSFDELASFGQTGGLEVAQIDAIRRLQRMNDVMTTYASLDQTVKDFLKNNFGMTDEAIRSLNPPELAALINEIESSLTHSDSATDWGVANNSTFRNFAGAARRRTELHRQLLTQADTLRGLNVNPEAFQREIAPVVAPNADSYKHYSAIRPKITGRYNRAPSTSAIPQDVLSASGVDYGAYGMYDFTSTGAGPYKGYERETGWVKTRYNSMLADLAPGQRDSIHKAAQDNKGIISRYMLMKRRPSDFWTPDAQREIPNIEAEIAKPISEWRMETTQEVLNALNGTLPDYIADEKAFRERFRLTDSFDPKNEEKFNAMRPHFVKVGGDVGALNSAAKQNPSLMAPQVQDFGRQLNTIGAGQGGTDPSTFNELAFRRILDVSGPDFRQNFANVVATNWDAFVEKNETLKRLKTSNPQRLEQMKAATVGRGSDIRLWDADLTRMFAGMMRSDPTKLRTFRGDDIGRLNDMVTMPKAMNFAPPTTTQQTLLPTYGGANPYVAQRMFAALQNYGSQLSSLKYAFPNTSELLTHEDDKNRLERYLTEIKDPLDVLREIARTNPEIIDPSGVNRLVAQIDPYMKLWQMSSKPSSMVDEEGNIMSYEDVLKKWDIKATPETRKNYDEIVPGLVATGKKHRDKIASMRAGIAPMAIGPAAPPGVALAPPPPGAIRPLPGGKGMTGGTSGGTIGVPFSFGPGPVATRPTAGFGGGFAVRPGTNMTQPSTVGPGDVTALPTPPPMGTGTAPAAAFPADSVLGRVHALHSNTSAMSGDWQRLHAYSWARGQMNIGKAEVKDKLLKEKLSGLNPDQAAMEADQITALLERVIVNDDRVAMENLQKRVQALAGQGVDIKLDEVIKWGQFEQRGNLLKQHSDAAKQLFAPNLNSSLAKIPDLSRVVDPLTGDVVDSLTGHTINLQAQLQSELIEAFGQAITEGRDLNPAERAKIFNEVLAKNKKYFDVSEWEKEFAAKMVASGGDPVKAAELASKVKTEVQRRRAADGNRVIDGNELLQIIHDQEDILYGTPAGTGVPAPIPPTTPTPVAPPAPTAPGAPPVAVEATPVAPPAERGGISGFFERLIPQFSIKIGEAKIDKAIIMQAFVHGLGGGTMIPLAPVAVPSYGPTPAPPTAPPVPPLTVPTVPGAVPTAPVPTVPGAVRPGVPVTPTTTGGFGTNPGGTFIPGGFTGAPTALPDGRTPPPAATPFGPGVPGHTPVPDGPNFGQPSWNLGDAARRQLAPARIPGAFVDALDGLPGVGTMGADKSLMDPSSMPEGWDEYNKTLGTPTPSPTTTGIVNPNDVLHGAEWSGLKDPTTRSSIAEMISTDSEKFTEEMVGKMPTRELLERMNKNMNRANKLTPQTKDAIKGFKESVERKIGAAPIVKPSTTGGDVPAPKPGGATTHAPTTAPTGLTRGNPFTTERDMNFYRNVNMIESAIWEYVPNLDFVRTHEAAIDIYTQWRNMSSSGEPPANALRGLIENKLKAMGVTMPNGPATSSPFGTIEIIGGQSRVRPTPGWNPNAPSQFDPKRNATPMPPGAPPIATLSAPAGTGPLVPPGTGPLAPPPVVPPTTSTVPVPPPPPPPPTTSPVPVPPATSGAPPKIEDEPKPFFRFPQSPPSQRSDTGRDMGPKRPSGPTSPIATPTRFEPIEIDSQWVEAVGAGYESGARMYFDNREPGGARRAAAMAKDIITANLTKQAGQGANITPGTIRTTEEWDKGIIELVLPATVDRAVAPMGTRPDPIKLTPPPVPVAPAPRPSSTPTVPVAPAPRPSSTPAVPVAPAPRLVGTVEPKTDAGNSGTWMTWLSEKVEGMLDASAFTMPIMAVVEPEIKAVTDEEPGRATSANAPSVASYEDSRDMAELHDVEVTGPLNDAVTHLTGIEANTRETADETRRVKELMERLVSIISNPSGGGNNGTIAAGNTATNSRPGSPPNYYSWGLDLTTGPNMGSRRPNGVT